MLPVGLGVALVTTNVALCSICNGTIATTSAGATRNERMANSNVTPYLGKLVEFLKEQVFHFQRHVMHEVALGIVPHGIAKYKFDVGYQMLQGIILAHDGLRMDRSQIHWVRDDGVVVLEL